MTTASLKMYEIADCDYVVAASAEDAWDVWREATGGDPAVDFLGFEEPLCVVVPDDQMFTCFVDEHGIPSDGGERVRLTAREWCEKLGRGFAFSDNF